MSDDEGYDYEVVGETFNDLFCIICLKLMRNAVQLTCGHGMCKTCLDGLEKSSQSRKMQYMCPICREAISNKKVFDNKMLNRVILAVKVKCKYAEEQCDWIGQIDGMKDHLSTICKYEEVNCTNTGCDVLIKRHELVGHISTCGFRLCPCEYCNEIFQFHKLNEHYQICIEYPIICPNACPTHLLRKQLNGHLKECLNELVQCDYHDVGCEIKVMRRLYAVHLEDASQDHLLLTQRQLHQTRIELNEVKEVLLLNDARSKEEVEHYSDLIFQKAKNKFSAAFDARFVRLKAIIKDFDDNLSLFNEGYNDLKSSIDDIAKELDLANKDNEITNIISASKHDVFLPSSVWNKVNASAIDKWNNWLMQDKNIKKFEEFKMFYEHNLKMKTRFNAIFYNMEIGKLYPVGESIVKLNLGFTGNQWFAFAFLDGAISFRTKGTFRLTYPQFGICFLYNTIKSCFNATPRKLQVADCSILKLQSLGFLTDDSILIKITH